MKKYIFFLLIFGSCVKNTEKREGLQTCKLGNVNYLYDSPLEFETAKAPTKPKSTITSTNPAVILLDYDGYTLPPNSTWNQSSMPFYATPSGLTTDVIQSITNLVGNDFAKFNVIVTTDTTIYAKASQYRRIRVIVTASSEINYGVSGIAYVGSMFGGGEQLCFVFSKALAYNPTYVWVTISHEAGHSAGLLHQSEYDANCNMVFTYKPCQSNGTGPIMGSTGGACSTIWWKGPTPNGCTSIQDDVAVLSKNIGIK